MIERVTLERTTYAAPPSRFEAGTPPIAEVIGLGAAIDYVESVGLGAIAAWEGRAARPRDRAGRRAAGRSAGRHRAGEGGVLSFVLEGMHPHDVGTVLDDDGMAVRAGHHCAQPVMQRFGIPATVRASFAFYNTTDEVDVLVRGVRAGAEGVRLMSSLSELYQNVILEHNRSPRNYRVMEDADRQAEGNNPLCGDQLTVWLKVEGDVIGDVELSGARLRHLPGVGLTDDCRGKGQVAWRRRSGCSSDSTAWSPARSEAGESETLGKLAVFSGVSGYPTRVKCASLPWHTLKAAMLDESKTEGPEL